MAFFIRRSSSSVMGLTIRSVRSQRPSTKAFSVLDVENRRSCRVVRGQFPSFVRFLSGYADVTAAHDEAAVKTTEQLKAAEKSFTKSTDFRLDGLPFDIKEGGPEEGYLTLIKKSRDEIMEVKVRPSYTYCRPGAVKRERIIGCLYMVVNIYYGDDFKKCVKLFVDATRNKINVSSMSMSAEEGTKHLVELEDLFNQRVIKPGNITLSTGNELLFACSQRKGKIVLYL